MCVCVSVCVCVCVCVVVVLVVVVVVVCPFTPWRGIGPYIYIWVSNKAFENVGKFNLS
jgi:hypothetical protein